mmetsp:Transcript_21463/g.54642  ORF Transcript_21463/g.54642 Transcript_21463/m.54642 type:complete len:267 (-) Transcript_21463:504-1304(-)
MLLFDVLTPHATGTTGMRAHGATAAFPVGHEQASVSATCAPSLLATASRQGCHTRGCSCSSGTSRLDIRVWHSRRYRGSSGREVLDARSCCSCCQVSRAFGSPPPHSYSVHARHTRSHLSEATWGVKPREYMGVISARGWPYGVQDARSTSVAYPPLWEGSMMFDGLMSAWHRPSRASAAMAESTLMQMDATYGFAASAGRPPMLLLRRSLQLLPSSGSTIRPWLAVSMNASTWISEGHAHWACTSCDTRASRLAAARAAACLGPT